MKTTVLDAAAAAKVKAGAQRLRLVASSLFLLFAVLLWLDAVRERKEVALSIQQFQEAQQAQQASGSSSGSANGGHPLQIPSREDFGPLTIAAYAAAVTSMVLSVVATVKDAKRKW